MFNNNDEDSNLYKIRKANDYHSYLRIIKMYPDITQLSNKDILRQICELFEASIVQNTIDSGRLYYEYVVYGLIPTYEQFGEIKLLSKCLTLLEISESCNDDYNLLRDVYVAKAKVYMYLNQFSLAEECIITAYNDYDYRVSTFSLLMQIFDSQNKFELMLKYLEEYCGKLCNFHAKISYTDLQLKNINDSNYKGQFKKVLEG